MFADRCAFGLAQIDEGDALFARAVKHDPADLLGQSLEGGFDVEVVEGREALQHLKIEGVAPVPAPDGAGAQSQVGKEHDARRVKELHRAQAIALRAGAHRIVEREQARFEFGQGMAADRAGKAVRKEMFVAAVHFGGNRAALGDAQCGLEGFGQTLTRSRCHFQPVDHHLDAVAGGLGEPGRIVEFMKTRRFAFGAHPHPHEALGAQVFKKIDVLALAIGDHRREHHQLRVRRQGECCVDHLRDALRLECLIGMVGAVGRADPGKEQPQVVVNLGDRADSGTRVVAGRFLLDRDGR